MTQVADSVTVEVGGAKVTIPTETVVKTWLDSLAAKTIQTAGCDVLKPIRLISFGIALAPGEHYAGVILGKDGAPDHHLVLLPGMTAEVTWDQAKEWAASVGGELPTRREQSLLFANLKEHFEGDWYWSAEQSERYSHDAWGQDFGGGFQGGGHESLEFRARAVRRLTI